MALTDSPVERLERICIGIKTWPAQNGIYEHFRSLFGATSDADLLRKMGGLHELVADAVRHAEGLTGDEFYLTWREPVGNAIALTRNLDLTAGHLQPHLEGVSVMPSLSAVARLTQGYANGALPTGFIELRDRADALRAEVEADEHLPVELKRFMLQQIDRILLALREFVIVGGVAAEDARDAVIGAVCLAIGSFPESAWTAPGKSYLRRVLDAVEDLSPLTTVSLALLALPPAVQTALEVFVK